MQGVRGPKAVAGPKPRALFRYLLVYGVDLQAGKTTKEGLAGAGKKL